MQAARMAMFLSLAVATALGSWYLRVRIPDHQWRRPHEAGRESMSRGRFGEAALKAPHAIQWLGHNGPQYTATASVLYAHELGLVPITTPAYSPQSNGLAEAFVKTLKRDYVDGAELRDAETVLAQAGTWFEDYNTRAPHSALGDAEPRRVSRADGVRGNATVASGRAIDWGAAIWVSPKIGVGSIRASS